MIGGVKARKFCPHGHDIAGLTRDAQDAPADRGWDFDHRLVGGHFHQRLVFLEKIARLDVPGDDLRRYGALAQIRELEYVAAHLGSMTALSASDTRAWPGKYSHSKACG